MTHREVVGRAIRVVCLAIEACLVPQRVRLGADAYLACNPTQLYQRLAVECAMVLEVVCDPQLAPRELVVDVEDRRGGSTRIC